MDHTLEQVPRHSTLWRRLSWVVLCLGVATTTFGWLQAARHLQQHADAVLVRHAEEGLRQVREEWSRHDALLRSFQSMFSATAAVERHDFRHRFQQLRPQESPAGLEALHLALWVTQDHKASFEGQAQAQWSDDAAAPDFAIRPEGERPAYLVETFLEPWPGQAQAQAPGRDRLIEAPYRQAAFRARDEGRASATPASPHSSQTGALSVTLLAPVYAPHVPLATVEQRRAAFIGLIGVEVRTEDLFQRALQRWTRAGWGWQVRDITLARDALPEPTAALLFATQGSTPPTGPAHVAPTDQQSRHLSVGGRTWEMRLSRPPVQALWQPFALAFLVGGLASTAALFLVLRTFASQYSRTERMARRLSREARGSEKHLRSILDHTVDGIVSFNENGLVLGANAATCRLFGRAETDIVGHPLSQLIPSIRSHGLDQSMNGFLQSAAVSLDGARRRVTGRDHDGRELPLELSLSTMDQHEDEARVYVGILRDLSAEQLAEASFLEARRQLNEVDEMRRVIVHNAPYAIFVLNRTGVIQTVNPAGEALLGYRAHELVGKSTTERFFEPEEVKERARMLALRLNRPVREMQVLAQLAIDSPGLPSEWTLVRADGRHLAAEITVTVLHDDQDRMSGYLAMASDVTLRREAESQLQHVALHDALTGLPNRNMVQEQLKASIAIAAREGHCVGLMFLDLDRFKKINDTLGHHIGDSMLIEVARRLRTAMRTTDIVARLGGDEFVILLPRVSHAQDGERVAHKVLDLFIDPLRVGPHELRVTPSIGLAMSPEHGTDAITLMRHADLAMYQAKNNGRNRFQTYADDMESPSVESLRMENELYHAIEREELVLHYQPQFDCSSGRITGVEALVRWEHGGKLVPPGDFIPMAEETGLIIPVGEWVLRRACETAQAWRERTGWPLRMAVNLSAVQLERVDIVALVTRVLAETGLPATALELEITESVVVRESLRAAALLRQLRTLGVSVVIDDFGVGYSSFSYLRELPVDRLKMDRSFLTNVPQSVGDSRLAAALIAMAHRLEVGITAEGVETEEQYAFLRAHGCDEAQGYQLGRPMPEAQMEALLISHSQPMIDAARQALSKIASQIGVGDATGD